MTKRRLWPTFAKELTQDGIEQANLTSILSEFLSHTNNDLQIFIAFNIVTFLAKSSNNETYVDSGCSRHLSPHVKCQNQTQGG